MIVRTRSSRLFVVLLHFLGVSTHFPSSWMQPGIRGVNPQSIVLESSDPLMLLRDTDRSYLQPHWIQDTFDHSCLGFMGKFSECGDATMWLVIPRRRINTRRRQWVARWATELNENSDQDIEQQGYALQMMDNNNYLLNDGDNESSSISEYYWEDMSEKECLTRRRKDNTLVLAPCSQERAWAWHFNENGILYFEKQRNNRKTTKTKRLLNKQRSLECVGRNLTDAFIRNCNGETSQIELASDTEERVVQIKLVRQATASTEAPIKVEEQTASSTILLDDTIITMEEGEEEQIDSPKNKTVNHIPSHVDIAHIHASGPAIHAELLKARSSSRRTSLSRHNPESEAPPSLQGRASLHFLKGANPILIANSEKRNESKTSKVKPSLHASDINVQPIVRRIQMNPYIANAKGDLWTDPRTGLVYRTDLSSYLGHDRKEAGRHTLTGVGQYMKTAFNIKVS